MGGWFLDPGRQHRSALIPDRYFGVKRFVPERVSTASILSISSTSPLAAADAAPNLFARIAETRAWLGASNAIYAVHPCARTRLEAG